MQRLISSSAPRRTCRRPNLGRGLLTARLLTALLLTACCCPAD